MYLEFYGLSEKPFSQTPDPRFLYWNDAYRETLASLSYGIRERKGFIAMLGEAGTGKTTLLRKLLDDLGDDIVSVFLFNPNATFEEILEYTLSELGISAPSGRKLAMLQRLNEFLLAAYGEGRNTILLIDEAQDLDSDVLESLRLLSNLETSDDKILQIVLSGQPELAEKLADPGLRQLKQRISVRCRLEPLQRDELPSYLSARLAVAGGSPDLFDPETFDSIWEFSTGIPRIINTVCDNALLLGYALGKRTIDMGVMTEVIADLKKLDVDGWITTPPPRPAAAPEPIPAAPAAMPDPPAPRLDGPEGAGPPHAPAPHATADLRPHQSAERERRGGALGWMLAVVLAVVVLLFIGAWLGRLRGDTSPTAMAPTAGRTAHQDGAASLAGATLATAATRGTAVGSDRAPAAPRAAPSYVEIEPANPPSAAQHPAPEAPPPQSIARTAPDPRDDVAPPTDTGGQTPPAEPQTAPEAETPVARAPEAVRLTTDPSELPEPIRPLSPEPAPRPEAEPDPPAAAPLPALEPGARATENRLAAARAPERTSPPSPPPPTETIAVAPGDTLTELAARRYGATNLTVLDMLRVVNPDVRDVDLIIAGSGLEFPDPGPEARILPDGRGFAVLAMTTQTLSRALAVQSSLEDRLARPVSLERVATRGGPSIFRVSVRGLSDRSQASDIAEGLGSILRDPSP